jgi:hypothetical protein
VGAKSRSRTRRRLEAASPKPASGGYIDRKGVKRRTWLSTIFALRAFSGTTARRPPTLRETPAPNSDRRLRRRLFAIDEVLLPDRSGDSCTEVADPKNSRPHQGGGPAGWLLDWTDDGAGEDDGGHDGGDNQGH